MGNGMYCDMELYCYVSTGEERLYSESRKTLDYLKSAHRRMSLLMKQYNHYKRNPLCGAMCKDLESKIFQQSLLLRRFHYELNSMVELYNHLDDEDDTTQTSTHADWEEVMEMAKCPIENVIPRMQSLHNAHGSSASASPVKSAQSSSPLVASTTATATASVDQKAAVAKTTTHKTLPWQITPPIEEVVELRQRLRVLEQSPLFTNAPVDRKGSLSRPPPLLVTAQRSPSSMP
ncbi:hypothetical protein COEREDRAFT_81830 [Coemansia reversa NRRL 1564]|uniref:Uncharacterized protein n=1 Tax=Coemansia reversa (strain ATCC 12441 / NRRL 1564) TaxID=763665 RepID=A0A2G5B9Q1_COERN|nr:hypothetical protein COEREDRAFT_81830 [Coemansia reversa NRRL 1564]|eukprot:PIA15702.1 hypothetical protein COEREDRAFT_81830 [Coemansia reversa NRRL 1564]